MAIIKEKNDFVNITSNITSFSHAYLFKVNDLDKGLECAKEFAKMIIFDNKIDEDSVISHQIDDEQFDDLFIVNPSSVSINSSEISNLMSYMETKSLRENGKRVYIICGYERITREISNKLLKFIEEPNDGIYGILLTMDIDKILPTIISRCQVISLVFDKDKSEINDRIIKLMSFFDKVIKIKNGMIAYINDYFGDDLQNREQLYDSFSILEDILVNNLKVMYSSDEEKYVIPSLQSLEKEKITNMLEITNNLKRLIKRNINLSLLLDRYIIELVREL